MKKASCVLIIVLLLLLEISAKAEWVSIVELRQQVDEMGRWIQNYTDTYGRQIEVDVHPMIPDVEVVPVLRVEPLDVVPDQIHPDMPLTTTDNEEGSRHYYDSETGEWMRLYEVCKGTICIEYANQDISTMGGTGQFGSLRGRSFCLDESNPDISYKERSILKGCVETISHVMKKIFPDKTPEYSFIWLEEISEDVPCAVLALRQKIAGIPVLMGAGDPVAYASEEEIGFLKPERSDAAKIQLCNRLEADEKMISYYTLDCSDEIEHSVVFRVLSPEEIYERKLTREQLHAAISMLPDKQAKRIYARYILGMSNVEIAKAEGVSKAAITYSIQRGMRELARRVKKF